ncbi:hypothetical protein [Mycetohabitans sp. B46]
MQIFKENRLAQGIFVALGRTLDLLTTIEPAALTIDVGRTVMEL